MKGVKFFTRKEAARQFLESYDKYSKNILRHIYFRVSNSSSAEDILSEAFLKTWQFIVKGGKINDFKSFLYKTTNNLIIDYYRKKSKIALSLEELPQEFTQDHSSISIDEVIDEKLLARQIRSYLRRLPPPYKEIIIYRYIDELTIKEIRKITGKTPANIYVIIHRGIKLLKNNLKEKNYGKNK